MKNCLFVLLLLGLSPGLTGQTIDTVAQKIGKIPHKHVDALAKFKGGDFNHYIAAHLSYHNIQNSVSGEVVLLINIESDGTITNVQVLKGISPSVDQELVGTIQSSPSWQPAMLGGKPTSMNMVLKIDMAIMGMAAKKISQANLPAKAIAVAKTPAVAIPPPSKTKKAVSAKATLPTKPVKKPAIAPGKIAKPTAKPNLIASTVKPVAPAKVPAKPLVKSSKPVEKPKPVAPKKPELAKVVVAKPVAKSKPGVVVTKKPTPAAKPFVAAIKNTPVKTDNIKEAKLLNPAIAKAPSKPAVKQAQMVIPQTKPLIKRAADVTPEHGKRYNSALKANLLHVKRRKQEEATANKAYDAEANVNLGQSHMPRFPGHENAFSEYISSNLTYPEGSKLKNIQGEVNLMFTVEKDGTISDIKVLNSPADDLSQESIRILSKSPKWIPAMQNGLPVKLTYTIPIDFKLQDKH